MKFTAAKEANNEIHYSDLSAIRPSIGRNIILICQRKEEFKSQQAHREIHDTTPQTQKRFTGDPDQQK